MSINVWICRRDKEQLCPLCMLSHQATPGKQCGLMSGTQQMSSAGHLALCCALSIVGSSMLTSCLCCAACGHGGAACGGRSLPRRT